MVPHFFLALLMSMGLQIVFAQTPQDPVVLKWSKTFGNNHRDESSVIGRIQHDYLVGGFSYNAKTKVTEARIFKMNIKGERAWEKTYADKFPSKVTHIIPSVKGGALVAMAAADKKYGRIRIMRISDADGSVAWQCDISFKESITPKALVENAEGEIFVAYSKDYIVSKDKEFVNIGLTKLSATGVLIWNTAFNQELDEFVINMLPNNKGEFVLLTEVDEEIMNPKSKEYYRLNIINQNGKLINKIDLSWLSSGKVSVNDFAIDSKNRIALVGDNAKAADFEPLVIMLDDAGKKLWRADWSLELFPKLGNDIIFDSRDNLVIAGMVENWLKPIGEDDVDTDMWVAKLDGSNGKLLWEKEIGGSYPEEAKSIALGPRGEIIVVGYTSYSDGDKDMSIIELEEDLGFSSVEPKIWGVLVGVAKYSPEQNKKGVRDLKFCGKDAETMHAFLLSPEGGSVPAKQLRLLTDEQATYDNITKACSEIFSQAAPQDLIVFYFSGHGGVEKFCAHDQNISHNAIKKTITSSAALKRLCIADACHSGSWNSNNQLSTKSQLSEEEVRSLYYQQLGRTGDGLALFMSSAMEETSLELPGLGHGMFTYYYIEGLKGGADANKDRIITIEEIFRYVYDNVSKKASALGSSQTPQINGTFDRDMPVGIAR